MAKEVYRKAKPSHLIGFSQKTMAVGTVIAKDMVVEDAND